jgi:hypothetical protein
MNLRRETRLGKKNKDEGLYFCSKKILEFVFILWKKDEAFDPNYQDKKSGYVELAPSFASVPHEPSLTCGDKEEKPNLLSKK